MSNLTSDQATAAATTGIALFIAQEAYSRCLGYCPSLGQIATRTLALADLEAESIITEMIAAAATVVQRAQSALTDPAIRWAEHKAFANIAKGVAVDAA